MSPASDVRPARTSLIGFFALVLVLSAPFFIAGALLPRQLLPGVPISALAAVCPALASSILIYRRDGFAGVAEHLRRSVDVERIRDPIWYLVIVALVPAVMALSYAVMVASRRPLPVVDVRWLSIIPMLIGFFIAGLGEELGWSGYAITPMQRRWGALAAAFLLGLFWAAWHVIPLLEAHRAMSWIAWWCLATVALRVLHVWIFFNTGKSVFGQALFHAMCNLSWQLFPNSGSHYDPAITGPILAVIAALVAVIWGPRTLMRLR